MRFFMLPPPKNLPIDLIRIESRKGTWLIAVEAAADTLADGSLLVKLVLEQTINNEEFLMRQLGLKVKAFEARNPDCVPDIARRIRDWIESTDGDGFLDMSQGLD
jgi:hypothetical protein